VAQMRTPVWSAMATGRTQSYKHNGVRGAGKKEKEGGATVKDTVEYGGEKKRSGLESPHLALRILEPGRASAADEENVCQRDIGGERRKWCSFQTVSSPGYNGRNISKM